MEPSPDIVLRLFGTPELQSADGAIVFPIKGYWLLALLILSPSGGVSRQAVSALLWADADGDAASTNLRQLLVRIRRTWPSGEPLVESRGPALIAGTGARFSDLSLFLEGARSTDSARISRGLAQFRGDLLQGQDDGNGEFSLWLLAERARLKERYFAAAATALADLTRYGRSREADIAAIAEGLLALEPEREDSYRTLLEAYGRNGNFKAAERLYAKLCATLKAAFGTEPKRETAMTARRVFAAAKERSDALATGAADVPVRPRVAFFPPGLPAGSANLPLYRALIEDVANGLSRYRTFTVIAAHSTFGVADAPSDGDAAKLRADYAVNSFVIPGTEQLSLRLAREPNREIVWAGEYPVAPERLVATFRLLSVQMAASLAQGIENDQIAARQPTSEPDAYLHYLEGQLKLHNCDLPMLRRARGEFRKAADQDRRFAAARARIAQTLQLEWLMLGGTDPYLLHRAKSEADAAIEIDPGGGPGHWMAAVVALYQRDYERSAAKFLEAETLNPNSADLLVQHADALAHFGEAEAGWQRFERAIEINPLAPDLYWWAGASIAFKRGDYAGAIGLCGRMESEEPVLRLLTACHALKGDIATARDYGQRLAEVYPGMSASEIVKLSPDRNSEANDVFLEGLRLAGMP